jgi:hypothetical protein
MAQSKKHQIKPKNSRQKWRQKAGGVTRKNLISVDENAMIRIPLDTRAGCHAFDAEREGGFLIVCSIMDAASHAGSASKACL